MKRLPLHILFFITSLIVSIQSVNAQYLQLTDSVFINYLKSINPALVNDGDSLVITNINAVSLSEVDLSNTGVQDVNGLQYFTNIHTLDLSHNELSTLPSLNSLIQLKTLNLSHNNFTTLTGINTLKNITTLDLSYNQITTFPSLHIDIAVNDFDISHNQLTEITTFQKGNSLNTMDISHNNISNLQSFENNFQVLNSLNVENNYIYFEDYADLFTYNIAINKESQKKAVVDVPSVVYVGDTLVISTDFDQQSFNTFKLKQSPESFVVTTSTPASTLSFIVTDLTVEGSFFIETTNSIYSDNTFSTAIFYLTVEEKQPDPEPEEEIIYQTEIIPDGTLDEQSVYLEGTGEATIFSKTGAIYHHFNLPYEWNGSNESGLIIPGYYIIKMGDDKVVKITVIY